MSKKTMSKKRIEVTESGVHVHDFDIPVKDVADYFQRVPEQKRETEFRRAIKVGVLCLERASTGMDLEFVKRQVQLLLANVDKTVGKKRKKMLGYALVVIGVLANNYVYLHDLVTDKHDGAIILGWQAVVAIVLTLVVVAVGLVVAWRAKAEAEGAPPGA